MRKKKVYMAIPLCRKCEDVIVLTVFYKPFLFCSKCNTFYHEDNVIWCNYPWLYENEKEE